MTIRDPEVLELLQDEPELLAVADAVAATAVAPAPTRSRRRFVAAAAVLAAAVAIALLAPWDRGGRGGIVERARAAIGAGPVYHSVMLQSTGARVHLRTGRQSMAYLRIESWFDSGSDEFRAVAKQDGRTRGKVAGVLSKAGLGEELYAPSRFADLYRRALEEGNMRAAGEGRVRGVPIVWLVSAPLQGSLWRVAVHRDSFEPVRLDFLRSGTLGFRLEVIRLETVDREDTPLDSPRAGWKPIEGSGGVSTSVQADSLSYVYTLADVRTMLGRTLLWPGPAVARWRLSSVQPSVEEASLDGGRRMSASTVALRYGPGSRPWPVRFLEIVETTARDGARLRALSGEAAPPAGYLDVSVGEIGTKAGSRKRWYGRMRKAGLYVRLESWSRGALVTAARSLHPVPRDTSPIDRYLRSVCPESRRIPRAC